MNVSDIAREVGIAPSAVRFYEPWCARSWSLAVSTASVSRRDLLALTLSAAAWGGRHGHQQARPR